MKEESNLLRPGRKIQEKKCNKKRKQAGKCLL
jgi:hypothetical protein